jgi:histidinol phosphatase-like PHP family hydrolase
MTSEVFFPTIGKKDLRGPSDTNARVSAALRELAAVQTSRFKTQAFKRAAAAVLGLDRPIETFIGPGGLLSPIDGVGPASARVILDVLRTGASPRVDREVQSSPKGAEITRAREGGARLLSRAEIQQVLDTPAAPGVISPADYRGDLQMHSVWSDGLETLPDLVRGCRARGYAYCAITDHSHSLAIAGGRSVAKVLDQHKAIDAINRRGGKTFRLLKGIEVNIKDDGNLDVAPADLAAFEVVLAAPHIGLRSSKDQTWRMLRAVRTRGVHVLAHPRGRMGGTRGGVVADWDQVFAAAAAAGVAVEFDGSPARQDLDYVIAERAIAAGCLFAADSDAHQTSELPYVDFAIAHARLAGVPAERVINCWPLDRLLTWLAR